MDRRIQFLVSVTVLAPAAPLSAQSATPDSVVQRALQTITAEDFAAKLGALAHDSTRGRETPSPELARATEWVARQFGRAGLRPAGDGDGYLQAFRLRHEQLDSLSAVTVTGGHASASWTLGKEIIYGDGRQPTARNDLPVVLMIGIPNDSTPGIFDVPVRGAAILHILDPALLTGRYINPILQQANENGALVHIIASEIPDELWEPLRARRLPSRWVVEGVPERGQDAQITSYAVQLATAAELLSMLGEDPATLIPARKSTARAVEGITISVVARYTMLQEPEVANVIGVLEGSDPTLRHEAVVFTGHIDHVGTVPGRCRPSQGLPTDSVCNGADDNASGTVGVIELAEAFAALERRPARTIVFAAVTAEERGLCGSRFYVQHPVIPIDHTVAAVNLDMIARNPRDTVGFVGKDYTTLGTLVERLLAEHSELGLVAVEHQGRYEASDHYPFAQRGVPALFFFSGEHEDLHTAADNPDRADVGQAARIVRLAFLVGHEVANAVEHPTWEEEARARIVRAP